MMENKNILAIESSGRPSSVAIYSENRIIGEFTIDSKLNQSVTLMPLIDSLLKTLEMDIKEMDYIACSSGPGSFTGLRIGGASAKAIAHSINKPMVEVPSLDGLAKNIISKDGIIVPIMDARRGQVYTGVYKNYEKLEQIGDYQTIIFDDLLEQLKDYEEIIFLGDGTIPYEDKIIENGYFIAKENMKMQRASSIALRAVELIKEGKTVDYNNFELMYLRLPQAQREYEEKNR